MAAPSLWQPMKDELAVVSKRSAQQASFQASVKELTVSVKKLNNEEEWLFVAVSSPHRHYWCHAAKVNDDGTITTSLRGFERAWSECGDKRWRLYLGKQTPNGVVIHLLKNEEMIDDAKRPNRYFCDERRCYGEVIERFTWEGSQFVIVPYYTWKNKRLSLNVCQEDAIYSNQIACRLRALERLEDGKTLAVTIECPKTVEQPRGLAFHSCISTKPVTQWFAGQAVGNFDETHQIRAELSLDALRGQYGEQELVCILWTENGVPMRCPVRATDWETALKVQSCWEMYPVAQLGERNGYLFMSDDHRVLIDVRDTLPAAQQSDCASLTEWLESGAEPAKSGLIGITGINCGGTDWQWKLLLPTMPAAQMDEVVVFLQKFNSLERVGCQVTAIECREQGAVLTVDMTPLQKTVENCLPTDWFPVVAARKANAFWYLPIYDPRHTAYDARPPATTYGFASDSKRDPIGEMSFAGRTEECFPHWARKYGRKMCWRLADQCLRYSASFTCRSEQVTIRFGVLKMQIRCPEIDGEWKGLVMAHRYKLEQDRKHYFIPYAELKHCGKYSEMTIKVKIRDFAFEPLYWDLRMVFEQNGTQFWIPLRAPAPSTNPVKDNFYKGLFFGDSVTLDKDYQLFLYRTQQNRYALVCQERTPYSGFLFRLKERIAVIGFKLLRKRLKKDNILLTYEKYCCMAQDNGFFFFKHCMDNDLESKLNRKIYFVIDKKAVDYKRNLVPYQDHVIDFMSLKHMIYLQAASLLVSSDSKAHAYAWRCKESILQDQLEKRKRLVFLQHGVIALKKVDFFSYYSNSVELFVTSNDRERDIIINELGYQPHEVIITGLTRWDVLEDRSKTADKKTILMMPTWRNWLEEVSDKMFKQSDYYRNYMNLLNSPRLAEYLERYDLYLNFYIHPKFREYMDNFSISGDRVRLIAFGSEPLNELMMECSMLITDYSSVCWDVYYLAKPVLFYQFDLQKYNETQGAYIDLKTELFGDRAETNDELFALMEEAAERSFQLKPKYAEMRQSMYKYIDRNNSQRVVDEITRRNW